MRLEERVLLSGSAANPPGQVIAAIPSVVLPASLLKSAQPLAIGSAIDPSLLPGGDDIYQIAPSADGRLIAQVQAASSSLELRLSLFDAQGDLLVQSDGQTTGRQNPLIDMHIAGGVDYELEVQSLAGAGAYTLSTSLTPTSDPDQPVGISSTYNEGSFVPLAVGDFTNDGKLDIVAADGVHLGTGDGTFEAAAPGTELFDPSQQAAAMAVGDFNGDGNLDVAVALPSDDSVSIDMGNGDGTFQPATTIGLPQGSEPIAIVAGDFTGTGYTDLAVADAGTNTVTILQNNGQGSFQILETIPVGTAPYAIAAGDFENDGRLDLAVANLFSSNVTILSNQGGGVFQPLAPIALPQGSTPDAIVAGNFGTGQTDLAVVDSSLSEVDILLGKGDGTFHLGSSIPVGANPYAIVAGDFNNDDYTDLATADANTDDVSILLGNGNGTFQPAIHMATGPTPLSLVAGDFTGDGRLDLATGDLGNNSISVLLGKGDGTFEEANPNVMGNGNSALVTGDFTDNGNFGVAVLDPGSNSVTILPGNGDGTFQQSLTFSLPADSGPSAIVADDFNGDGRADLAIAEQGLEVDGNYGAVQIFLGNGDGTFDAQPPISAPGASSLVAGDFTDNGRIDLAVASISSDTVTILMGNRDGTFTTTETIPLGVPYNPSRPTAIVAGDFGNGQTDLAVADIGTDDVTVLMNDGQGYFTARAPIVLGSAFYPTMSLVTGNFTSSGYTDLAVATSDFFTGNTIQVLLGQGDGNFLPLAPITLTQPFSSGVTPVAIVAGDFTDNGITDLATADSSGNGDDYSVYLGNGQGGFSGPVPYALGGTGSSTALVAGDFLGNGPTDLAIAQTIPDQVYVRLSNGDGTFSDPSVVDLVRRDTPVVTYFSGTATPGVAVVDSAGEILYRAGIPGEPGTFEPPVTVNPLNPSRDIAFVQTQYGPTLASVDADDNKISFFVLGSSGFELATQLPTGLEPAQILAADLEGNGVPDLVVRNAGDGTISIYPGNGSGWFGAPTNISVGLGTSDVEVGNLQHNGLLDIIYADRLSGEVGVLQNLGGGAFAPPVIYEAGPGPYDVTGTDVPTAVTSLEGTDSVTVGTFTPGGLPSIVALNPGSNTFGILAGLGGDRFANDPAFPTDASGLVVRAITLGTGATGLAILTPDGLYVEQSDGFGDFLPPVKINVGFEPNGLTVANLGGSGGSDLLISNPLGDVQVLLSNPNGSFQAPRNLDQQVAMTAIGPNLLTPNAFIYSDKLTDQLVVKTAAGVTTVLADASTGLISPGAIKLADLNGDGIDDLIVANSGSNNVLIYPGLPNGTFGPAVNDGHGYFTGTNPVGITVYEPSPGALPDLIIANKGSNDVAVLINTSTPGGPISFEPGPRLQAGIGPVATAVADVFGTGQSQLVILNSGSNNVVVLPSVGNGFFNDQNPTIYPVGTNPSELYIGNFTGGAGQDIATINAGSNTVSLLADLGSASPMTQSISSGGLDPTAGFAVEPGTAAAAANLVVANSGNGSISLFEGGENGFSLNSVLSTSGLPNPSALALASFNSNGIDFWTTNDGEQSASLLSFNLEESTAEASSAVSPSATLVSLNSSSLALIGTLLTVSLNLESETAEASEGTAALVASGPGGAGQSLSGTPHSADEEYVLDGEITAETPGAPPPVAPAWARYVSGVDQAIERVGKEADQRLFQEQAPAKSATPGTTLLKQDGAGGENATATFVEEAALEARRRSQAAANRLQAVDLTIGSWSKEGPSALRSVLARDAVSPVGVSLAAVTHLVTHDDLGSRANASCLVDLADRSLLARAAQDDHSEQGDLRVSRWVALAAFSATALAARDGAFRRSQRRAGSLEKDDALGLWL